MVQVIAVNQSDTVIEMDVWVATQDLQAMEAVSSHLGAGCR